MPERNLNFDEIINRRGTDCLKYDFAVRRGMPEDVLPLWVADMDFKTTSYVEDAVIERTKHGIFGYSESGEEYFKEVAGWMRVIRNDGPSNIRTEASNVPAFSSRNSQILKDTGTVAM